MKSSTGEWGRATTHTKKMAITKGRQGCILEKKGTCIQGYSK
jgi:hypothetical protein